MSRDKMLFTTHQHLTRSNKGFNLLTFKYGFVQLHCFVFQYFLFYVHVASRIYIFCAQTIANTKVTDDKKVNNWKLQPCSRGFDLAELLF